MKTFIKIAFGLVLISIIATIFVYPSLPAKVPSHWNFNWEIDGYANKNFVFFTALLPFAIYLFLILVPKIDPRRDSYAKHQKAYGVFSAFMMLFLVIIHWLTVLTALKMSINPQLVFSLALGALFMIIGNYMSQIRPNYTFGIKTPWTLADPTVWKKTHRQGSFAFMATGIIFILSGILGNSYLMLGAFIFIIVSTIYLFIYSYLEFKKIKLN